MRITRKGILSIALGIISTSCVERFFPDTETNFSPKLVINGFISADESGQEIVISESSTLEKPELVPVSGCIVSVEDQDGHSFPFTESAMRGHYRGSFEGSQVIIGSHYRLSVKTPTGKHMLSRYEELLPCPVVDSVSFQLASKATTDPKDTEKGLQFYIDFKGSPEYGNYFRWKLVETYEYHSTWPLDKWLDEEGRHDLPHPDYSHFVCYKTDTLADIFVLSTKGFTRNSYENYKLHFVNDRTQRLLHKYSLLVNQYSVTEGAYNYWLNLKKNNQETVNLFGRQPANVKGNIYNANDTTDIALGYFGVSAVRSKRIMIQDVQGLKFDKVYHCKALVIDGPLPMDDLPIYFALDYDGYGVPYTGLAIADCIFCEMLGGTTQKPIYWDTK
jgi:hypothetical protein